MEESLYAVVVTYNPNHARLIQVLRSAHSSVERVVLVDNGSEHLDDVSLTAACPSLVIKRMGTNTGIGAAQNQGISEAIRLGASQILFLDQDSVPESGMVHSLSSTLRLLTDLKIKVGCVGPRIRTPDGARSFFAKLGWFRVKNVGCSEDEKAVECDFLLSSGTLVPAHVLKEVGNLDEKLFIDLVDTEWCFRARAHGYRIFGDCHAALEHRLGEQTERVWLGRWRQIPRHKPFRYYYMFRNALLMTRRAYVPLKWKLFYCKILLGLFLAFGLFGGRKGDMAMMIKGVLHGVRGVTGKLEATA
jgi:rhamnosyltransferase